MQSFKNIGIFIAITSLLLLYTNCDSAFIGLQENTLLNSQQPSNDDTSDPFDSSIDLPNKEEQLTCFIYIDNLYRFDKSISKDLCQDYCQRVRPTENCVSDFATEALSANDVPISVDSHQGDKGTPVSELETEAQDTKGINSTPLIIPSKTLPLPAEYQWTKMYSHPTMGITEQWLNDNYEVKVNGVYSRKRGHLTKEAPGGGPAFVHSVTTENIVEPFRFEGTPLQRNNSLDNAYLMRFKHYVTAHGGAAGKLIELEGGRGWVAERFRYSEDSVRGSTGWGANIMHPVVNNKNYYRLLASYNEQKSSFGDNMTGNKEVWPIKEWVTVDLVVKVQGKNGNQNQGGYRLYVNGQLYLARDNINIFLEDAQPKDANSINYYIRLMNGGNPDEHMAQKNYTEYFKDLQIFRGTFY